MKWPESRTQEGGGGSSLEQAVEHSDDRGRRGWTFQPPAVGVLLRVATKSVGGVLRVRHPRRAAGHACGGSLVRPCHRTFRAPSLRTLSRTQVLTILSFTALWLCPLAHAEQGSGGMGGFFIQLHTRSLSSFDAQMDGNPLVVGGLGFGMAGKNFRIGGGGGGGFLMNASENVHFGMGFGGVIGEYLVTRWLSGRLLIGGGGYGVAKVISETDTDTLVRKISTGGFILFFPSINFEIPLGRGVKLMANIGYFMPSVKRMDSVAVSASLLFGK